MSTVLHPVGPQRARVYWVRRLLVVLVVVALAVLATTAVSWLRGDPGDTAAASAAGASAGDGPASGGDAPAGRSAESEDESGAADGDDAAGEDEDADADASDDEDTAPSTPVECTPEALQLTLASAAVQFPVGTDPVLTATVTNVGDEPCTVDAGDASREVVITSGEDRVWSTKDCATEQEASRQLLLGAGAADAVPVEWSRVRSAEGCPAGLPDPAPGTYQAVAHLGDLSSQTVVFVLR